MVEIKVTCDRCKKRIKDPTEEAFFHVTIREKCIKPDGYIYPIDEYDMTLCEECEAMLHEKVSEAKTAVKRKQRQQSKRNRKQRYRRRNRRRRRNRQQSKKRKLHRCNPKRRWIRLS